MSEQDDAVVAMMVEDRIRLIDLEAEIVLLRTVEKAARKLPRETPSGGGASTIHDYKIAAHAAWANDAALTELDAFRAEQFPPKPTEWETFRDISYYDMWCVREVGERRFQHSFHLVNEDEARGLAALLTRAHARMDETPT